MRYPSPQQIARHQRFRRSDRCCFCGKRATELDQHDGARCLPRPRRWCVMTRRYWILLRALSGLAVVACGGQVEREGDGAPYCHEVRGYFADQRCSQRITFDVCAPPEHAYTIRAHKCTLVRP